MLPEGPALSLVAIALFALVGSALSALTAALSEIPQERLKALRDEGGIDGLSADRLLRERDVVRARLLAGRVLSVAGVSAFTAHLAAGFLHDGLVLLSVGAAALVYAILSEIAQTSARRMANRIGLKLLRFCRPLELLLAPVSWPVLLVSRATERLFAEPEAVPSHIAEREVEHILDKHEEQGALSEGHAELLMNVLEFKDTIAREVMVPRTRMVAIDAAMPIDEVVERVVQEGHSRYPVYRERLDRVEGMLHAKDLFQAMRHAKLSSIAPLVRKNVLFVPEAKKIGDLLKEMQVRRQHLAVVVDEFGGTSGIVTLEDILEEIVGEIQDEHDAEESLVQELEPGRFLVDARVSIHDLAELIDAPLTPSEEGFDSLGGLVIESFGRVPHVGEEIRIDGIDIMVREADDRTVQRVEIIRRSLSQRPQDKDDAHGALPGKETSNPGFAREASPPPSEGQEARSR